MSTLGSRVAIGLVVIGVNVILSTPAAAQVCARPAGSYETYGDTVIDKAARLAWKRCSAGQTWDGVSCTGRAARFTFGDAQTLTAPSSDGFQWRIPRPEELATLVVADRNCTIAIDQEVFPRTSPGLYWTGLPLSKVAEYGYCQSFSAGASASERQNCWAFDSLPVRLVSVLPARGYSPPAPVASRFTVEESGNFLVVLGSNFSPTFGDNLVNFPTASGMRPVVPDSSTSFSLRAPIPADATTGMITVTSRGVTSQPVPATLRVINNKDGCAAAGFTPATLPQSSSSWDYCILPSGFKDSPADAMVIGAHPTKLPSAQPYYMLATSSLSRAAASSVALSGTLVLQYGSSGLYGALVVASNAGQDADAITSTGSIFNNGLIDTRGTFNNFGALLNRGNGVILNAGIFTNSPAAEKVFSIESSGTAIHTASFSNVSGAAWPRAQLKNLGTLVTQSASTGIENSHGDIINGGTILLQGANVFANRSGSAPGTVTNSGTIQLRIGTQPEGVPILLNEPGATITNASGGSISNTPAAWTIANYGAIQNCGNVKGAPPAPNGYAPCPPGAIRRK